MVEFVSDFNLSQVWMVEDPMEGMERHNISLIDKYIKNRNLLENHMNEQDVEDVRDVIEDVMTRYLFELADEATMKAVTKDIAAEIHIEDYFDYLLEATIDQDSIVIDLCVKPSTDEDFVYFTASYTDFPGVQYDDFEKKHTKRNTKILGMRDIKSVISAYDDAMKGI